jgi:hypothetical protein
MTELLCVGEDWKVYRDMGSFSSNQQPVSVVALFTSLAGVPRHSKVQDCALRSDQTRACQVQQEEQNKKGTGKRNLGMVWLQIIPRVVRRNVLQQTVHFD